MIDRAWPTHEMRELVAKLGLELGVMLVFGIGLVQFIECMHQGLGHEAATKQDAGRRGPEVPLGIGCW